MLRVALIATLLLVLSVPAYAVKPRVHERTLLGNFPICPGYELKAAKPIPFNPNEQKLICGDPDAASWENIPAFQAKYFIKTFLQDRGYYYPTFSEQGEVVVVDPGPRVRVRDIAVIGSPPAFFDITRRRKIKNAVLTPSILNTLESWTRAQMRDNGYPCPQIKATADAWTGDVRVDVDPGDFQRIVEVVEEEVKGLRPGILARYRAFNIGDPYNARNLSLTSTRIEKADGILQSSYFLTECTDKGAVLTQKSIAGPPRLIRVGVGVSTEDFIIGKFTIKWARIGLNGSSFQISARGSYNKQWLDAQAFIYPLPFPTRWHLNPFVATRRWDQSQFEYTSVETGLPLAVTWDTQNVGFRLRFGPKYMFVNTQKGAQKGDTHFVSASARLDIASHDYDYYLADPKEGFAVRALVDLNSDKIGSSVTAQRFRITGESMWNIGNYDPTLLILALRGLAGVTLADTDDASFARLPPNFLYYLGGSTTLRGFTRYTLPSASRGALTALYAGAEVRLTNVLPLNFQPLIFMDVGATGQKSFDLDFPVYWSPGFGVRWPSFVGVFRLTFGYGFLINNNNPANNRLEHWQFFWSFGEEF